MSSIMDQERPWERDPKGWDKPKKPEPPKGPVCQHEWILNPKVHPDGFVYDYAHYICPKCGATRMS